MKELSTQSVESNDADELARADSENGCYHLSIAYSYQPLDQ